MLHTKVWHVDLYIDEHDDETHAEARLRPDGAVSLRASGAAQRSSDDASVPEIGDEIAVARALQALAQRLLQTAGADVEGSTHQPAHLRF